MGRYTYPCPGCGLPQQARTQLSDSREVAHQLCPSCTEAKGRQEAEAQGKDVR